MSQENLDDAQYLVLIPSPYSYLPMLIISLQHPQIAVVVPSSAITVKWSFE